MSASRRHADTARTRRLQRVRLFLRSFVLYRPWIPGEHRRGICTVECVTAHLRGFEKDSRSEVVFWIDELSIEFGCLFFIVEEHVLLSTLVSPSLPCASCRSVDRIEATSFLSAIGVGLLIAVLSGVFTARQMKNELCVSPHSFEVLAVCVRSRIQNELRDSYLLHERTPPSCLLVVLLHGYHLGVFPVVSGYRFARPATEAPAPVHCYSRGRRCTAAPNEPERTNHARTATSVAPGYAATCQPGTLRMVMWRC